MRCCSGTLLTTGDTLEAATVTHRFGFGHGGVIQQVSPTDRLRRPLASALAVTNSPPAIPCASPKYTEAAHPKERRMSTSVEELAAKAQELSLEDRARLAENLLSSLQDEPESEVEAAWDREIERRVEEVRAGTARLIPAEDVHAEARQIYR